MKKPEFSKPRIIREDFLPEKDPMKKFRIKKVTDQHSTRYYPQEKFFGLWRNILPGSCDTLEYAQYVICEYLRKPVVEYIEFDCGENK